MMKRSILLSFTVLALAVALSTQALAQLATGNASSYTISMTSIELCSSAACSDPILLGSGSKDFDIASAAVGSAIGSYASTSGLPIGRTFTHVRVTLSRIIKIAGNAGQPGGVSADCITDGTPGTAAAGAVLTEGGTLAVSDLVVPNIGAFGGQPDVAAYAAQGITLVDGTTFQFLIALTSPTTVGTTPPNIDIAFQTQNAVAAVNDGSNDCRMFPQPPVVTLTIN